MDDRITRQAVIDSFRGAYRFLSNFHPCRVALDGQMYRSVEHAYQAAKTMDRERRKEVHRFTAGGAKRWGDALHKRPDWNAVKLDVMLDLLRQKFLGDGCLAAQLLATGERALIEGNTWGDTYWGTCRGCGKNHLGRLLMQVRSELRRQQLSAGRCLE
ncbi:MAG TPA: NADAR family protein [Thermoanaerobaculia bacterium]|jgi:hypothetical protein|nr:NADAR family protein [Thermoanaerobaculia bacterium]